MSSPTTHQRELRELFSGSAGGRAIVERHGTDHMRALGALGGRTTVERHGAGHMRALGALGGSESRKRLYRWPKDVYSLDGTPQRRIPYYPPRSTRRRRRPVFVYVEVAQ